GQVTIAADGKISGVAAGEVSSTSTDAINGSQLHAVATEAGKHTTLSNGKNTTVESTVKDGQTDYKVNVAGDLTDITSVANGDSKINLNKDSIIISNGNKYFAITNSGIGMSYIGADYSAKSIMLGENGTTISGGLNVAGSKITGVAAGAITETSTDAVNGSQLHAVATEAGKHTTLSNGKNTTVNPVTTADGHLEYKVDVNDELKDIKSIIGAGEGAGSISFADGGIKINNKVTINKDGKITGVAAGAITETSTDAVNGSQLHAVATEAGKHTTLSNGKNTTVESTVKDGQTDYKVNVAGDLTDITSVANGDSKINLNKDSIIISNGNKYFAITNSGIGMSYIGADYSAKSIMLGENGTTISGGLNVAGSKITGVAAGVADTDAVNVGQLKEAVQAGNTDTHIKPGEYGVGADNKVNMDVVDKNGNKVDTVTIKDVAKASDVGNVNNIASDIKNKEGKTTVVDAVNNLNDKVGNLQYSKVEKGEIADGDSTTTAIGKLDQKLTDVAATAAKHTKVEGSSNITVNNTAKEGEAANYKVELNKDIDVDTVTANSVTTGQTVMNNDGLKVGENVSVTGTAVTAGQASISNEGLAVGPNTSLKADELKVDGKNYIDKDGLNANGQHITNVKAGEADTDAVNYGQLKDTNNHIDRVENQVVNNTNRISNLDNRVNKVGAGAAALAALHPLDFDPDAKWDFAAGYGNYRGANAAAVGAYYRPNEDTMFSVGGTFGNGENMVNAGVSFKLGSGSSHVSTSRVAMAKEIKELRGELEAMKSAMLDANAGKKIDTSKLQLFPDVPQNHWAYEYVAQLAGNGMIEGYPDGNFAGDRPMTRYEFAAILYRAMTKGAVLSDKILSEFSHELEYFTVDTIAKDKAGNPTIQRVRTVKENKNK
uniref:S-layer homology domain-containing protein n=1 Tax=Megasphaera elsdenii TaxID=907 RepID=UPI00243156DF